MPPKRYESSQVDPSPLGKPLHFVYANRTMQNRFLKAAMTERLSSWSPKNYEERGIPSKNLINVYKRWGEGDVGLILTGNIMMEFDQLEAPGNPIIPRGAPMSGDRFEAFKELAKQAKAHGSACVGQVSHPGRQVENRINSDPISASDIQLEGKVLGLEFAKPHPATETEIKNIIEGWAHSAEYLEKAGYDGIQLHGAHGYLLAQFLSETTNRRADQFGGTLAKRAKIVGDIVHEIRRRVSPSFIIGIKMNSVEFQNKGFQPEEAKELCKILDEELNLDFVELSGGTYEELAFSHKKDSTRKREAFFLDFADMIAPALKQTKTYVTGGLKTVGAMVDALKTVDGVGLGRPICQEPRICKDILEGKVHGAIEQLFDQDDFGLTNVVAGSQIRQVGRDQEPMDGSKKENVDAFMNDMGVWADDMGKDAQTMNKYGYVDLNSLPAIPYGTTAAS